MVRALRVELWFFLFFTVVLSACSATDDSNTAESQVPLFHQALDATQFESLYENSSAELKKAVSKKEFIAYLNEVHDRLGNVKSAEKISSNVNFASNTYVTLSYNTEFERGKGSERFIYRVNSKQVFLYSYHIQSSKLPTNFTNEY